AEVRLLARWNAFARRFELIRRRRGKDLDAILEGLADHGEGAIRRESQARRIVDPAVALARAARVASPVADQRAAAIEDLDAMVPAVDHKDLARVTGHVARTVEHSRLRTVIAPARDKCARPVVDADAVVAAVGHDHPTALVEGHREGMIELSLGGGRPADHAEKPPLPIKELDAVVSRVDDTDPVGISGDAGRGVELPDAGAAASDDRDRTTRRVED